MQIDFDAVGRVPVPDPSERSFQVDWMMDNTQNFHAERLESIGALIDPYGNRVVYSGPAGQANLLAACHAAAAHLPGLAGQPIRSVFFRAAYLAGAILRDGCFKEVAGVDNLRTAIHAGWQLLRFEGGRPMVTCDSESALAANDIRLIDQTAADAPVRTLRRLFSLYAGNGVCQAECASCHFGEKICHDASFEPKRP